MHSQRQKYLSTKSSEHSEGYTKPPRQQDHEQTSPLFPDQHEQYRPEYLQLPIKVQGNLRNQLKNDGEAKKQNESSLESNQLLQQLQCMEQSDEKLSLSKQIDKDLYELMDGHKSIDFMEALLMPFYESNPHSKNDNNPLLMFEQPNVKVEEEPQIELVIEDDDKEEEQESEEQEEEQSSQEQILNNLEQKKTERGELLSLMNSFRTVTEATRVVFNYYRMNKKDYMNKVHTNVFDVLSKESLKLESHLQTNEIHLQSSIRSENHKLMQKKKLHEYGMNKELGGTSAGHEDVKIEENRSPPYYGLRK